MKGFSCLAGLPSWQLRCDLYCLLRTRPAGPSHLFGDSWLEATNHPAIGELDPVTIGVGIGHVSIRVTVRAGSENVKSTMTSSSGPRLSTAVGFQASVAE